MEREEEEMSDDDYWQPAGENVQASYYVHDPWKINYYIIENFP